MDRITMSNTNTTELFKRAADWIEASTDGNNVSIVEVRVSDPVMYITAKITRSIGCIETTIAFSAHSLFNPESSLTNTRQFENLQQVFLEIRKYLQPSISDSSLVSCLILGLQTQTLPSRREIHIPSIFVWLNL